MSEESHHDKVRDVEMRALKDECNKLRGDVHTANCEVRLLAEKVVAVESDNQSLKCELMQKEKKICELEKELAIARKEEASWHRQADEAQRKERKMVRFKKNIYFPLSLIFFSSKADELKHAEAMLNEALKRNEGNVENKNVRALSFFPPFNIFLSSIQQSCTRLTTIESTRSSPSFRSRFDIEFNH